MWNVTRSGAGAAADHKSNVWGGTVLAAFALIALAVSFYRPGPAGFFGPIMWPRLFSILILMAGIGMASGQLHVRNKQDFFGGVALIGLAVVAFLISIDLPGMRGFAFGPGTAPRLFAGVLATLGLIVAITGLFTDGPEGQRFTLRGVLVVGGSLAAWFAMVWLFGHFTSQYAQPLATLVLAVAAFAGMHILDNVGVRGPFMITLAIFAFAMFIRPLGLVIASFLTILICAAAADDLEMHKARATALILLPIVVFPIFVYIWPFPEVIYVWPFGNIALREIVAAALSFAICFAASPDARWRETVIIAGALTLFCAILFPWGLNLPFQLWPRFS
jgi:hypothetical protein